VQIAHPRRFVAARLIVNLLLALVLYAITIPNCFVPDTLFSPAHFNWSGLLPPTLFLAVCTFALWLRRWFTILGFKLSRDLELRPLDTTALNLHF